MCGVEEDGVARWGRFGGRGREDDVMAVVRGGCDEGEGDEGLEARGGEGFSGVVRIGALGEGGEQC
jgi:hypothetical protein